MDARTVRAALELGARMNERGCGVVLFGGEPLLEKDLIREAVDYARGLARRTGVVFHFKITTNGLLLDEDMLDFMVREEVLAAFSFDGVREAHDAHRVLPDGQGTFDLLLPRLHRLLELKPYSTVISVVNPDTAGLLADSVSFLLDQGVRYLIVALNYAADWQDEHLEALRRQYQRLGRLYVKWTRAGRKFYLSPFEVKLSSHIHRDRFAQQSCDLGVRQVSVDPEGYLFPCVQFPKAGSASPWCIGHVGSGIDKRALRQVRVEAAKPKQPCCTCSLAPRCLQTCACLNWQATGSIHQVSPMLCSHERMLTEIVDRVGAALYRRRDPLFIQKHYNEAYPLLSLLEDHMDNTQADLAGL